MLPCDALLVGPSRGSPRARSAPECGSRRTLGAWSSRTCRGRYPSSWLRRKRHVPRAVNRSAPRGVPWVESRSQRSRSRAWRSTSALRMERGSTPALSIRGRWRRVSRPGRARLGRDGGRVSRQDKNIGCSRTASSTHIGRILPNMTCGTMAASCTSTTCGLATAMLARASWRRTRATPCVSTEAMSTEAGIQHSPAGCASRSVPTMSSTTFPRSAESSRLEFKIRGSGRRSGARVVRTQERRRHGRTP